MKKIRVAYRVYLVLNAITLIGCLGKPIQAATDSASLAVGTKTADVVMVPNFDGMFKEVELGGRKAYVNTIKEDKVSLYLYFKTPDSLAQSAESGDLYVTIEYYDSPRQRFSFQYDDGESPYSRGPSGFTTGADMWVKTTYKFEKARLSRKQNGGADFRIDGPSGLAISSIEVSWAPRELGSWPSAKERLAMVKGYGNKPQGMEYTFGSSAGDEALPLYKALGVTSVETYVTWETVESKAKGQWDWSQWDKFAKDLQEADLKWVPFLIVGPAYSTPDWFRNSTEHVACVCLEHNTPSKIESLWNPFLPAYIDRFLGEFAKRYRDTGILESVLLGIQGDFGEAIYSVFGGGWTFVVPGRYHNHPGFWCGDEYARANFREWAVSKYGSVSGVNKKWGTDWKSSAEINFPANNEAELAELREKLPAASAEQKRRWLDFVDWYRGEMTRFADWWMEITRKHFPNTPIYLCTGGCAPPHEGADFGAQCKVAARHGAGVRITNEASNYAHNLAITRWVAAAGKHYGAYYGFEPAGGEDLDGIVARVYNATASGAAQLHDYAGNVSNSAEAQDVQQAHMKYLRKENPVVDVALWYPNVALTLKWDNYLDKAIEFRDIVDYDYVDEGMLRDGALKRYKVLVMIHGDTMESGDFKLIERWVRSGGTIVALDFGGIKTVEGDARPYTKLFDSRGRTLALGKGKTILVPQGPDQQKEFVRILGDVMKNAGIVVADGANDGVYATQLDSGAIMFLNTTQADVEKTVYMPGGKERKFTAKAKTITEVEIER